MRGQTGRRNGALCPKVEASVHCTQHRPLRNTFTKQTPQIYTGANAARLTPANA